MRKIACLGFAIFVLTANSHAQTVVKRYDDADDFLPQAQAKNVENIRLFLKQQDGESSFDVRTKRNVLVKIFYKIPDNSKTAVLLLAGGSGVLSVANNGKLDRSFNFISRSRDNWWKNNIATFLIDAPSDKLNKDGMSPSFRNTKQHQDDLIEVINEIKIKFNGKLAVAGFSDGGISLANIALANPSGIEKYLMVSAAFNHDANGKMNLNFPNQVIMTINENDSCKYSPADKAQYIFNNINASKKEFIKINGGSKPISGDCGPFSNHSYFGIESKTINAIAKKL
jgi:predicted esterase